MPLLRLLPSHHEVRVNLCMPLPDHEKGLLRLPVSPLLQRARRPAACATGEKNNRVKTPGGKSSTKPPQFENSTLYEANDGGAVATLPTAPPLSNPIVAVVCGMPFPPSPALVLSSFFSAAFRSALPPRTVLSSTPATSVNLNFGAFFAAPFFAAPPRSAAAYDGELGCSSRLTLTSLYCSSGHPQRQGRGLTCLSCQTCNVCHLRQISFHIFCISHFII